MRPPPFVRLSPVILVLILGLLACGRSAPTPTPAPSPQALIEAATARFAELQTAHFVLTIEGDVFLDPQQSLTLRGAEGNIQRPDRAATKADLGFAGATISVELVSLGPDQYMTNFLTGRWEQAPADLAYNPAVLFDPERGIQAVLRATRDVTLVGNETVAGVAARHLRGVAPRAAVTPVTGAAFHADPIDFDLWIDAETSDILKVVLHDTAAAQGAIPATWTLELSRHNEPVHIERPAT
ncbi:MAG: LppX_LprAFG lipoprotein [Sphaerobacter sp.]|nr:LppX_LprAFG lipoprotein [Sphaerobacter sp.]